MRDDNKLNKLYIDFNGIDRRWKVLDQHGYCVGDGRTIDQAVDSARIVTDKPIFCSADSDEIFDNISLADRQAEEAEKEIVEAMGSYLGDD